MSLTSIPATAILLEVVYFQITFLKLFLQGLYFVSYHQNNVLDYSVVLYLDRTSSDSFNFGFLGFFN